MTTDPPEPHVAGLPVADRAEVRIALARLLRRDARPLATTIALTCLAAGAATVGP